MPSCFQPGSNRRPCACEAHVITTTLWKLRYPGIGKKAVGTLGPSGATDNASDYGSEDCRFESCLGRYLYFAVKSIKREKNILAPGWARTTNLSVNSRTR